jgi:hypothetical protein
MLNDDAKVESLALERTTEQGGQQQQSGRDRVDPACIFRDLSGFSPIFFLLVISWRTETT